MKKGIAFILVLVLAAAVLCTGASANSWGLTGELYGAVEKSKAWDDYSCIGNQAGDFAVMGARYHNALFCADGEGQLHVYTTAVYQPEDKRKDVKLAYSDRELTMSWGKDESYTFIDTGSAFELTEAVIGDFRVEALTDDEAYNWRYAASDAEETVVFPAVITLDTFNIRLFPHSVTEVRDINLMRGLLDGVQHCLGNGTESWDAYSPDYPGELLQPKKKGTAPVYSAPDAKKAWRAGKGKAAVGTNGSLWVLNRCFDGNGDAYACIRYDVSGRTQRIGWALCGDLGLPETPALEEDDLFVHTPVEATSDTFLTDDPDVSQFAQFTVKKGTKLTCLGMYNEYYAYVASETLAGKGSTVWGFVPLRDLKPADKAVEKNEMKRVAGVWYVLNGGSIAGDILTLDTDGSFISGVSGSPDEEPESFEGVWYITKYDPAEGLSWAEPAYRITLLYRNGLAQVYGLSLTGDGETPCLILSDREGAGGYFPNDVPPDEYDEEY